MVERDLAGGIEAQALTNLIRLERLLAAHAGFDLYLEERHGHGPHEGLSEAD